MPFVMIPSSAPRESTSRPPLAPLLTAAVNGNGLSPCPAPGERVFPQRLA
jgi:hypothetical protein